MVGSGQQVVAKKWMLKRGDKEHGPMSSAQLKKLAKDGKLKPSDLVQVDGGDWKLVTSVKGLIEEKPPVASPTPPPIPQAAGPATPSTSEATPFPEWYATKWPSKLRWYFQGPLWLFYGFVWIPVWYVVTTTAGGVKERGAALPGTGKAIACLPLLLPFVLVGGFSSNSPSSNRLSSNRSDLFEGEADTEVANSGPPHGQLAGVWRGRDNTVYELRLKEHRDGSYIYESIRERQRTGLYPVMIFNDDGTMTYLAEHQDWMAKYEIKEGQRLTMVGTLNYQRGLDTGKFDIAHFWTRIDGKGFTPFISLKGTWKCRKTGANFNFKLPKKSSFVGVRSASFDVDKAGEQWEFNFRESGIVYAHPKKNVANSRSRIGKFSYDGTTLIIKLALTAVRADLGKIPWEYEFELQRY